jgi:uncharacterized membrane protein YgcG
MQDLLIGSLGTQILGFVGKYPWQVFAVVLVTTLILVELFRKNRSGTTGDADIGGFDFGGGDGGCGD